jgi:hypothetical protein
LVDKEKKYTQELERCRENIKKTQGLIEYHKNMLKTLMVKEKSISSKLETIKMSSLCDVINKGGYDIDLFRKAVQKGDFSGVVPQNETGVLKAEENSENEKERK